MSELHLVLLGLAKGVFTLPILSADTMTVLNQRQT